jgi:hypothetical protein
MKVQVIEFNLKSEKLSSIICFRWHTRMKLIYFFIAINKRIQDNFSNSNYCIRRKKIKGKKRYKTKKIMFHIFKNITKKKVASN